MCVISHGLCCNFIGLAWFQLKWSSMLDFYLYLLSNAEETRTRAAKFSNKVLYSTFWLRYVCCSSLPYSLSSTVSSLKLGGSKLSTFMAMQRCRPSQCSQSGTHPAELSVCVSSARLTPGALVNDGCWDCSPIQRQGASVRLHRFY